MNISDLFSHLKSISSSLHTHWNFFSAVALGIAAGLAMTDKSIELYIGVLLIVGLTIFLASNYSRISQTIEELKVVKQEIIIKIRSEDLSSDFKEYYVNSYSGVNKNWYLFHIIIDCFLILVIVCRINWN